MRQTVSHLQAAGLALLGYTLWVLCDVSLKFAGASSLPQLQVVALVGLAVAAMVAAVAILRGDTRSLRPRRPSMQALRSMLDLGNNLCVLIALQHVSLSMFYIVIFLAPLVAALLARTWLHETLSPRQVLALAVGFLGIVIAVNPFSATHGGDRVGYLACLVCVACFSGNMVWSRRMVQSETTASMTFFSGLVIALVAGVGSLGRVRHVSPHMAGIVLAVAFFGVLGNLCFFFALRHARTAYVSQFHYSQLPVGALVGFALWRERPTLAMIVGAVLIVAAGMYTAATGAAPKKHLATTPSA